MMAERTLRVLEFTRIREILAEGALTETGAERCRSLTPWDDLYSVNAAQEETEEATVILQYTESVSKLYSRGLWMRSYSMTTASLHTTSGAKERVLSCKSLFSISSSKASTGMSSSSGIVETSMP